MRGSTLTLGQATGQFTGQDYRIGRLLLQDRQIRITGQTAGKVEQGTGLLLG